VTSSVAVFEAAIWEKSQCIWYNRDGKQEKKRKYGNRRNLYI